MKVEVHRNECSKPIVYENVISAYTKGDLYCVLIEVDGVKKVHKYPLISIFRVVEDY